MKRIALLALIALAPMAQAGAVIGGIDLTPPADFIMPVSGRIGVRVIPATQVGQTYYGARDLTPSAGYITPSTRTGSLMQLPVAAEPPVEDAGTSFTYGDE